MSRANLNTQRLGWHTVAFSVLLAAIAIPTRGDVFVLANGGRIEAEWLNPNQAPRQTYLLRTSFGGLLTLNEMQVDRVVVKTPLERSYEARLPSLPDTAAAHWDMAERCHQAKLKEQRTFHLEQVLRLQPDHEQARHALGFSRVGGRWMRQEDVMVAQGYEHHRGRWRLPQAIELEQRNNEYELRIVRWRKQLKNWRSWIVKGRDRRSSGEHEIRRVRDPDAAVALSDMLDEEKENRGLSILYVDVLGELRSAVAVAALARHALHNRDPRVREACLDKLTNMESRQAVETFTATLRDQKNFMVHRAAAALAALNDTSATIPLINALITEHKELVGGGGGIQPAFTDRGAGLSFGGKPKIRKIKRQNDPVLHCLNVLHPGVNFGFNQMAWKNWYIASHTPPPKSLRRSE